ncbi:PREDICTED: group XV phospholipase A2-like [Wasmannia auropunctata]|uniref:group XV phospholipase A2-like n=1 Tax=Wasmannia auropunctata TaxID=64793 RepID=UPI0005EE8A7A|nr:PREDICTED: group XV phospholipase A2-like [Wasmannia auropunctata]XP_011703395.1 PREDICTED: group XV phospholipase A2-like [Wasmannia auropunctata]XP_011703396.1 PREDICTED: group XV phospholipase A2-like [Wasmannia auropunctata]
MRLAALLSAIIVLSLAARPAGSWHVKTKQISPVILVPGDGGSQVNAKINKSSVVHYICAKISDDYFNLWLNMELLVPVVIDCFIDNLKLNYDNVTRTTSDQPGVDIQIPGWGDPFVVEYIDPSRASPGSYFKDIGNMLVNELGYIRNLSLRGAPYDFRKGPSESEEFFAKLKELVEETYVMNNNTPVTLLAHSMGGPMSLIMLQRQTQKWKDKYVNSLITLSAVWAGSIKAVKVFAIGDDLGAYFLRESVLRNEQITSPSLGWLLPSKLFWKDTEILVQSDKKNYTLNDLQQYFIDIDVPNAWEFRKDNEKYQLDFSAPGVEVHCLYGSKVDTVEKLYYKPGTSVNGYPQLIVGDGDGTVNIRSLEACTRWQQSQKQKIYNQGFPGVDHTEILRNHDILAYIKSVLKV